MCGICGELRLDGAPADPGALAPMLARLARDPQLARAAVEVRVRDGVVHLRGRVGSARLRERAVRLARGVPGVRRVLSQLSVADP